MFQKKLFAMGLVVILLAASLGTVSIFAAIGDDAKPITVNSKVTDKLASGSAINNYVVELSKPGKVSITFKHDNLEKSISYWEIDMFDSEQNKVMDAYRSQGVEQK